MMIESPRVSRRATSATRGRHNSAQSHEIEWSFPMTSTDTTLPEANTWHRAARRRNTWHCR
jgi:hypothetical protein